MSNEFMVFVVDEDPAARKAASEVIRSMDLRCKTYASGLDFLDDHDGTVAGCLVMEIRMMAISGLQVQQRLLSAGTWMPIVFLLAQPDVRLIVKAMRNGALQVLEKPYREQDLWDAIQEAMTIGQELAFDQRRRQTLQALVNTLTAREREVLEKIADNKANRVIAAEFGVGVRTIEIHRAKLMAKLEVETLAELIRLADSLSAAGPGAWKHAWRSETDIVPVVRPEFTVESL